jgi:signal transduction histidine kinase
MPDAQRALIALVEDEENIRETVAYALRKEGYRALRLAIVKAIVEGYGGKVSAANREGGGAVFEFRLPAS